MTWPAEGDKAATNVESLLMFVAALRAVAPDLLQAPLLKLDMAVATATHREMPRMGQRAAGTGLGMDLWDRVTNSYGPMAVLVRSMSEEQIDTAQLLLDGMLQESRLAHLVDSEGRKTHAP